MVVAVLEIACLNEFGSQKKWLRNTALKIKCQEKFAILVLIAASKKVLQQQYFEFYSC